MSRDDLLNATFGQNKAQLAALGNGILALSNEKLGGSYGDLPQYLRDLLDKPAVTSRVDYIGDQITSVYAVHDLASFEKAGSPAGQRRPQPGRRHPVLPEPDQPGRRDRRPRAARTRRADREPGVHRGRQQPRRSVQRPEKNFGNVQNAAQALIGVSTRNHEANYHILSGDLGVSTLAELTHFDWPDKGVAAAGLVNWIAQDGTNTDHSSPEYQHATQAARILVQALDNTTTDKNGYGDTLPSSFQNFYSDFHKNSAFSSGLANIANTYLDDFAEDAPGDHQTRIGVDGSLSINDPDRQHFLALVGADPNALKALSIKAGEYEAGLLQDAQTGKRDPSTVLSHVANLNGELAAAPANVEKIDNYLKYQHDSKAYSDTLYYVGVGKAVVQFGGGLIPGGNGAPGLLIGQLVDAFTHHEIKAPTLNEAAAYQPPDSQGAGHLPAAYDYLNAALATGKITPDQLPAQLVDNSGAKPHLVGLDHFNDPSVATSLEDLTRKLGGQAATDYIQNYDTQSWIAYQRSQGSTGAAILQGEK
ncbi:TPR repeat region-containing protein [Fodinicola feengrottensis]